MITGNNVYLDFVIKNNSTYILLNAMHHLCGPAKSNYTHSLQCSDKSVPEQGKHIVKNLKCTRTGEGFFSG